MRIVNYRAAPQIGPSVRHMQRYPTQLNPSLQFIEGKSKQFIQVFVVMSKSERNRRHKKTTKPVSLPEKHSQITTYLHTDQLDNTHNCANLTRAVQKCCPDWRVQHIHKNRIEPVLEKTAVCVTKTQWAHFLR